MSAPSYTYSFVSSGPVDAIQYNQNFSDMIDGMSLGGHDGDLGSMIVNGSMLVSGNIDTNYIDVDTTFETQTFNASILQVNSIFFNDHSAYSGNSALLLGATAAASGELDPAGYSFNKIVFNSGVSDIDFHTITDSQFSDGDIVTLLYQGALSDMVADFTLLHSHVCGNLRMGSDLTLPVGETATFIYNETPDTLDLLYTTKDVNRYF